MAIEIGGPHLAVMSSTQEIDNPAGQQIATRNGVGLLDTLVPEVVRSGTRPCRYRRSALRSSPPSRETFNRTVSILLPFARACEVFHSDTVRALTTAIVHVPPHSAR